MTNRLVRAVFDPTLEARIVTRQDLFYDAVDHAADQPAHVRAASGIAWLGDELVIVQDDTSFLALFHPDTRRVHAVGLPADQSGQRQFDVSRGNKKRKLDLETCFVVDHTLVALGSGSHERREHVVLLSKSEHGFKTRVVLARNLYRALRERTDFAGSELNVEGALRLGDRVRLFQRGNGESKGELHPHNASLEIALDELLSYLDHPEGHAPAFHEVIRYELGECDGIPWTFTDATLSRDGQILFVASAEGSPNAVDDGEVVGTTVGLIAKDGSARMGKLLAEDGERCRDKVEGVVFHPTRGAVLYGVIDPDDHTRPAQLLEIELTF